MRHFALIGKDVSHSLSATLFAQTMAQHDISDCYYSLFSLPNIENIRSFIDEKNIVGFNITNPYKEDIVRMVDMLDHTAAEIGAVNCVAIHEGLWRGYNTDFLAVNTLIDDNGWQERTMALIMGTGGAAKAVAFALQKHNIPFLFVSRNKQSSNTISYQDAYTLSPNIKRPLLINATPIGMGKTIGEQTWQRPDLFDSRWTVFDLIYNPSSTALLRIAAEHGCQTLNGYRMLEQQALASYRLWHIL